MPALRDQIAAGCCRRRAPETAPVRLTQRRIYILPTRGGLLLGVTLLLMLLGCINYNLGLGYVLTFLLTGVGLVSMLHTFRNLAHLELRPGRAEPVFAGEQAVFPVLSTTRPRCRASRSRCCRCTLLLGETNAALLRSRPLAQTRCDVRIPTHQRGRLRLPRLRVFTTFPLGTVSRLVQRRAGPDLPGVSQAGDRRRAIAATAAGEGAGRAVRATDRTTSSVCVATRLATPCARSPGRRSRAASPS